MTSKGYFIAQQQKQAERHAEAARAMLAALKKSLWIVEMAVDDERFADEIKAMRTAIAQAEAAGITS